MQADPDDTNGLAEGAGVCAPETVAPDDVVNEGAEDPEEQPDGAIAAADYAALAGQNIQLRILIPDSAAGGVIGRGGATITKIRDDTKASVNVIKNQCPGQIRVCVVKGTVAQSVEALKQIMNIIHGETNQYSMSLLLEERNCGALIGKGGKTITELRNDSGAKIDVQRELMPASTEKRVDVKAAEQEIAADAIERIVYHIAANKRTLEIRTEFNPDNARMQMGMGMQMAAVQASYGMMPGPGPMAIMGPMNPNHMALGVRGGGRGWVSRRTGPSQGVAGPAPGGEEREEKMIVKENLVGGVIGQGGRTIDRIRKTSGCYVTIEKFNRSDRKPVTVTMKGNNAQIACAREMINQAMIANNPRNWTHGHEYPMGRGRGRGRGWGPAAMGGGWGGGGGWGPYAGNLGYRPMQAKW